ncbi:hypothetical protein HHL19_16505 [Streptomyces sp. R302]|uniref:hypothetical protein n=1 Tax=unclassified Streptomyces TaxID=2593676 RepID=UPI00145F5262|nr:MULTISPECIES: hypothetical protein [unclassified Streptomyces]NML55371.1 hypothetical protein [Streptomyces sp. R301]NML80243.1 hypothetical protein [Streptomyces sp. R302]
MLVHSRSDREAGAETWLILAAHDKRQAQREWAEYGVALLRCGKTFTAIRVPAEIVHAVAGTSDRDEVASYLATALDRGPCFFDGNSQSYYALAPRSAAGRWSVPGTEALGGDFFLGVPATTITAPDPRCAAWWVVPMEGPAALCDVGIVRWLVERGRMRLAEVRALEASEDA